ncbi:YciI family protein [Mesobacillus jeotgali]|uniref:YciI family protein n=1 Tax=Mesobacillus jeotgali TaxID=129985 RepID=UPI0015911178|nr:YciI family protein [Mesobacillus jeotgali]
MYKFVVFLKDKRHGELDSGLLARHIEHLRQLNKAGQMVIAGPLKNNGQAMIILNCDGIDEAIRLVEKDPFIQEKYYNTYDINELIVANEENNWLIDDSQTKGNLVH